MENILLTKEELLRQVNANMEWEHAYSYLSAEWQEKFLDFCTGTGALPLTYDPFFKKIFDAEAHPERLSRLLSLLLGQQLNVCRALPNESMRIMEEGSLLIMDVVVQMEDGSIADVEIQKIPYRFPGERAACYSADLLMRQYVRVRHDRGKVFSYHDIKKVYTIIILEKSEKKFHNFPNTYIHKSRQRFDTGLDMELLQEYVFIALDRFREIKQNTIEGELDAWIHLFSSNNPAIQLQIARQYPLFKEIYEEISEFRKDIGGVLFMFSDALRILDRNTVQLMIDEMSDELDEMKNERDRLKNETNELKNEKDRLKIERNTLENEKNTLESEKNTLENEKNTLESEKNTLENEKNTLEGMLRKQADRIQELEGLLAIRQA